MTDVPIARGKRGDTILLCRKCLKRIPRGKKLPGALKSELRALTADGEKKPRVVMTSCFGICPKRAVVATSGAHMARREYLLVDGGNVGAAARALRGPDRSATPQSELRAAE
jgi:predicted metal-binding protein